MSAAMPVQAADDAVRTDSYRVLARLFAAPPDATLLHALAQAPRAGEDALGAAWNALCEFAARAGASAPARLDAEYNELFCGVGEPRVMRYGSWYLSGSLMDQPLARLRDDLARLGFARDAEVHEPEDHFAALLEVLAMLVAAGHPEQRDFFQRHLAPWYAQLCRRLEGDTSEFYRLAARLAHSFLDAEVETMAP